MVLSQHQRRQLQQRATEELGRVAPWLGPLGRRVFAGLLLHASQGWNLFVRSASTPAETADAFMVGPGGVFPVVVRERLPEETVMHAVVRHAEEGCAGFRGPAGQEFVSSTLRHVVILPGGGRMSSSSPLYQVMTEQHIDSLFRRGDTRLTRGQADSIAGQVAQRLGDYQRVEVQSAPRASENNGLLDAVELTADQLVAAQQRPFETWMTFLHPQQHAIVTRNYGGPARISGPAGTGKTVVALHRLRYLARNTTGPLLFTTFVRTLPAVHQASFQRLAPELADRVRFISLHAWIRCFLAERGRPVTVDSGRVNTAFSKAWIRHRAVLEPLQPTPGYWQAEIDRVIKGRGLTTVEKYFGVERKGRVLRLSRDQKAQVWQLYETYQQSLAEKGQHDYNDLILLAEEELRSRPLEKPFAGVVVDEVQDITLIGLRMLRQLAGDGPNGLLLVGDGQQQVYPGGWRLSEAGIPVRGRGEVLRVNYRNRSAVLGFAQGIDTVNQVDDLDGAAGVGLDQVDGANSGGEVRQWNGTAPELSSALVDAIAALPVPRGQTALITFNHHELEFCKEILRAAQIPLSSLDRYTGEPDETVKIGTVHRAKGLEFQAVLAVVFVPDGESTATIEQETRELHARQQLVAATRARDYLWWAVVQPQRSA